uniref:NAD-dependent epimerase/dehydratase family protein n=1 Tax=candidate division WOR-3 bacterium TaxID=2052148 RepID=A0A7C4XLG3_UNCW3
MIFVLGYKGFVGGGIYEYFQKEGLDLAGIDVDNYQDFVGKKCDIFINANGNSKKYLAEEQPLVDFELSVTSVLKTFLDFQFKKYIYISSIDVYNRQDGDEYTKETAIIEVENLSNYGFHKYLAENLVRHYCKDWLIVRLAGMIGPNMKKGPVYDIINERKLWVSSKSRFLTLSTYEVARALIKLFNVKQEIYNIVASDNIELQEVAKIFDKKIVEEGDKILIYKVNCEKINKVLKMPTSLECIKEFQKICSSAGNQ